LDILPEGLRCPACGKQYPVIGGIPVLVSEPMGFLRSELAALTETARTAAARRELLDSFGRDAGLTSAARERHRDVLSAELARAESFLALLEPAARALEAMGETQEALGARRSGWSFDSLFPYLLRDWTDTDELRAVSSIINAALQQAFADPSGKSIAVAGCGAGGLLAEIAQDFAIVTGFDLTFPVLAAARHLLDGGSFAVAMPRSIRPAGEIALHRRHGTTTQAPIEVLAMDVFDTAFADASVDCVITSFLIDLIPNPRKLAEEIHRILVDDGVWINYGPSGPLNALWRFDQTECTAFFEAAGFKVVEAEAHRATYLDLSRDCPSWSFRSHMCYLTSGRKTNEQKPSRGRDTSKDRERRVPDPADISERIPQHFAGATLIYRQGLGAQQTGTILVRHERLPGNVESLQIGNDAVPIVTLVDGERTVRQIAEMLHAKEPAQAVEDIIRAFARYFDQGLLNWRDPSR
jgi:SAM-dependent methyltransferase